MRAPDACRTFKFEMPLLHLSKYHQRIPASASRHETNTWLIASKLKPIPLVESFETGHALRAPQKQGPHHSALYRHAAWKTKRAHGAPLAGRLKSPRMRTPGPAHTLEEQGIHSHATYVNTV